MNYPIWNFFCTFSNISNTNLNFDTVFLKKISDSSDCENQRVDFRIFVTRTKNLPVFLWDLVVV